MSEPIVIARALFDQIEQAVDAHARLERWGDRGVEFSVKRDYIQVRLWICLRSKHKRAVTTRPHSAFEASDIGDTPEQAAAGFIAHLDSYAEALRPRDQGKKR